MPQSRPKIDKEFAALLPAATPEVLEALVEKLGTEGFRDPLVVWQETNILLDGHHRLKICDNHGIDYTITYMTFESREAAKQWVIENQLARRNLTDEQRDYYIGLDYLNSKKAHGDAKRLKSTLVSPSAQNEHLGGPRTAKAIAAKHGVHASTVRRNAEFAQAVDAIGSRDPERKAAILNGKGDLSKAEVTQAGKPGNANHTTSEQNESDQVSPPLWWQSPAVAAEKVKSSLRKLREIQHTVSAILESPLKSHSSNAQRETGVSWVFSGEHFEEEKSPLAKLRLRRFSCEPLEEIQRFLATLQRRLEGRGPATSSGPAPWDEAQGIKREQDIRL